MILSVIIRNIKAYNNYNYIKVGDGTAFSAFVGENGVGKSSILEALDSYFNGSDWNLNHSIIEKGFSTREPHICPVFMVRKDKVNSARRIASILEVVSQVMWNTEVKDFNSALKEIAGDFCKHRDLIKKRQPSCEDDYYLFSIGLYKESKVSKPKATLSVFESNSSVSSVIGGTIFKPASFKGELYKFVRDFYSYIYIPSDIDYTQYTKIESSTVQSLMGESVGDKIKKFLKNEQVRNINRELDKYLVGVTRTLGDYKYVKPGKKQSLFNVSHFSEKVLEAYFEARVLNLVNSRGESIPVYNLSSGEKRKAIIDISKSFLSKSKDRKYQQVIFALDEPEISLHVSSYFEQFKKLIDISNFGVQTIITTHWYGFMPMVSLGSAIYLSSEGDEVVDSYIDLRDFRGSVRKLIDNTQGPVPYSFELKGINDLVQSIISSITGDNYKWIICEGVSDKIYLEGFSAGLEKLVVLPIGKSHMVKRVYEYLCLALRDNKSDVKGKVFCLVDTDARFEQYDSGKAIPSIKIKRLLNCCHGKLTKLMSTNDNTAYPPTEVEDVLNPYVFYSALISMAAEGPLKSDEEFVNFVGLLNIEYEKAPSGLAFELTPTKAQYLSSCFDKPGVKVWFANKYSEFSSSECIPPWFEDIRCFLYS